MSFWNEEHKNTGGNFESAGGDFEPLPANTGCLAAIKQASWSEYEGDRYINIQWQVLKPEQYKGRVIFHKVRVLDADSDKADRAKRMLAAIDTNAGGKLLQLNREPDDYDLASALVGKIQGIKVQVWKMEVNGEERSGNWVSAVAPSKKPAAQAAPQAGAQAAQPAVASEPNVSAGAASGAVATGAAVADGTFDPLDDDLPF